MSRVPAPSESSQQEAAERLAALATPPGALGGLGDLGVWVAARQSQIPPMPLDNVRLVIFAGDHGIAEHGVSAFPQAITGAMVRTFLAGKAGVSALAKAHNVSVRVLDLGVNEDFDDLDEGVRGDLTAFKIRKSSGPLHLTDALSSEEALRAFKAGSEVARQEIAAGAQLLLSGDMGIGNTTPAATMIAATLGWGRAGGASPGTATAVPFAFLDPASVNFPHLRSRPCPQISAP